jgi:hypothetical protein
MQCRVTDGLDREIVAKIRRVLNQVNSFIKMVLRADELIGNQ